MQFVGNIRLVVRNKIFLLEVIRQILMSHRQQNLIGLVKFEVSENFLENVLRNGQKYGMLMYSDNPQDWLDFGQDLLNLLVLVQFSLSEMGQIKGFRAFSEERTEGIAWNLSCWCILTTFRTD